jgi:peptidoglycan/LPS O-acetylase OafA/YrhL
MRQDSAVPSVPVTIYRPEIDGLRALAVLLVILVHAFPEKMPNGFIGVDIFFVISGYLITGILLNQLQSEQFSIRDFYIRRANRIFPALILVLIACLCFGWLSMFADEFKLLGRSVASGAGFIANINLLAEGGYWDISSKLKPLLHLWSLGVEEQFYFLWPVLLWGVWRTRLSFLAVFAALFLASLFWNLYFIKIDQAATFYLPFSRFWELIAGGALAYFNNSSASSSLNIWPFIMFKTIKQRFPRYYSQEAVHESISNLCIIVGLFLITCALLVRYPPQEFPGRHAILPVLGTVLILASDSHAWLNSRLLSNRLLVYIGLISFPLYLWHWPLLAFGRIIGNGELSIHCRNLALILTVILAIATFHLLENPVRKNAKYRRITAITLALLLTICGATGYFVYTNDGFESRYFKQSKSKFTESFTVDASKKLALIGDSNAAHLLPGLQPLYQKTLVSFTTPGWPYLIGTGYKPGTSPARGQNGTPKLTEDSLTTIISDQSIDIVVVSNMYVMYLNQDTLRSFPTPLLNETSPMAYSAGLRRTIKLLTDSGKKVILVKTIPFLDRVPQVSSCLPSSGLFLREKSQPEGCLVTVDYVIKFRQNYEKLLKKTLTGLQNVSVFDTLPYLCDNQHCYVVRDGILMYKDMSHLSEEGSRIVGQNLAKFVQKVRAGNSNK